jgi:hypothetical protein
VTGIIALIHAKSCQFAPLTRAVSRWMASTKIHSWVGCCCGSSCVSFSLETFCLFCREISASWPFLGLFLNFLTAAAAAISAATFALGFRVRLE